MIGHGATSATSAVSPPVIPNHRDWRYCLCLVVLATLFMAVLQPGQWVPGNDSDVYVVVARALVNGQGFVFNGQPVAKVPPTWPLVLAGAMIVTPAFWLINAIPLTCLALTLGVWYWILRRYASPAQCVITLAMTTLLFPFYRLSFLLHSDAFFMLLLALAILLAHQIAEGRRGIWGIVAIGLLAAALVTVRWAGMIACVVLAAAAVSGQTRPRLDRRWLTAIIVVLAVAGTFVALRVELRHYGESVTQRAIATAEPTLAGQITALESSLSGVHALVGHVGAVSYVWRLAQSGSWLTWLLWQPAELGASSRTLGLLANLVGWLLILPFLLAVFAGCRQRQWIWLGVLVYCGALCSRWPHPNTRYLVPVLPLLLLGIGIGLTSLTTTLTSRPRRVIRAFGWAAGASVIACNLGLYAIDARIHRASDFYAAYRAGQCKDLVAYAHWLRQQNPPPNIAVNYQYLNLDRQRNNSFGYRAIVMLTDLPVHVVPLDVCDDQPNDALLDWATQRGISYYLRRPPVQPWRLGHFRAPWLQERMTGQPVGTENPFFELYRLTTDGVERVRVPDHSTDVSVVPGVHAEHPTPDVNDDATATRS